NGDDLAAELVAHRERRRATRAAMRDRFHLGAADADGGYLQHGLARRRNGLVDVGDFQNVPGRVAERLHGAYAITSGIVVVREGAADRSRRTPAAPRPVLSGRDACLPRRRKPRSLLSGRARACW